MASELLKRSEVREEDTWKTSDMYENTGAWENELKEISALVDKAAAFEGKAAENADNLFVVLETLAKAGEKIEKAFNYAERLFDEDQTNTTHQAMSAKVYSLYAAMGSKTAFVLRSGDPCSFRGDIRRFLKGKTGIRTIPETVSRDPPLKRALPFSRDGKAACNDS